MTRVLGVIPARYASSRFPGKPLIDLKGKSMIQRVFEGVMQSTKIQDTVVATDDHRIFEHVENFGGKAVLTKKNHQSGTDRCGEVIEHFKDAEIVLNIQGDEPLINFKQLDQLVDLFEDQTVSIGTLATNNSRLTELENPNRIKVVLDNQNNAMYFSRSLIPFNRVDSTYQFLKHIGVYGFRSNVLKKLVNYKPCTLEQTESLEQLRWMYYGHQIRVGITEIETPNIDTPADVKQVLDYLNQQEKY